MKNIFLDTNIIIDLLLRPDYKQVVQLCLSQGKRHSCKFVISSLTVANFAYIARKLAKETLYIHLKIILELFDVSPTYREQISRAIAMEANDFEDALQYQAAIDCKCDCIISRNVKDFVFSSIPVYTPEKFLELLLG